MANMRSGGGGLVAKLCPTLGDPMGRNPPGSSVHGIFQARITGVHCHSLLQGIFPTQGLTRSPALQVDSLLTEPPGKPNVGGGKRANPVSL